MFRVNVCISILALYVLLRSFFSNRLLQWDGNLGQPELRSRIMGSICRAGCASVDDGGGSGT